MYEIIQYDWKLLSSTFPFPVEVFCFLLILVKCAEHLSVNLRFINTFKETRGESRVAPHTSEFGVSNYVAVIRNEPEVEGQLRGFPVECGIFYTQPPREFLVPKSLENDS